MGLANCRGAKAPGTNGGNARRFRICTRPQAAGEGRPAAETRDGGRRPAPAFVQEPPVTLEGFACAELTVADLDRTAGFYARVFGFRVAADARGSGPGYVIMHGPGDMRLTLNLTLNEAPPLNIDRAPAHGDGPRQFAVGDLDRARAALWDLGVPLAAGSPEPAETPPDSRRSLFVDDPDGHRLELVETGLRRPGAS